MKRPQGARKLEVVGYMYIKILTLFFSLRNKRCYVQIQAIFIFIKVKLLS
jgi:hypothetical protein